MNLVINQDLINAVDNYLAARAVAEVTREKIDEIALQILNEREFIEPIKTRRGKATGGERITNPKNTWLMGDEDFSEFCKKMDRNARDAGLKPVEMGYEFCPALVAESDLRDAQHALIDQAAVMLRDMNHAAPSVNDLLCNGGLEKYQEYIDLVVKMVLAYKKEAA